MQKKEFIEQVSSLIKYKNVRHDIEEELDGHVEELKKDYIKKANSENMVEDEVIEENVIKQMGDIQIIAKEFNRVYRPKYDWILNIVSVLLLLIGLFIGYSLVKFGILPRANHNKIILLSMSMIIASFIIIFNYKSIEKYSLLLFFIAFIATLLSELFNAISQYYILILVSYIISYSGLLNKYKLNKYTILMAIISMASVILLGSLNVIMLCLSYITITILQREFKINKKVLTIISCCMFSILSLLIIVSTSMDDIKIYRRPEMYAQNEGYIYMMKEKLLENSKFIGKSSLKAEELIGGLSDDNIFTYIIAEYGILCALVLVLLYSIFIYRLIINVNKINDMYGKNIFLGCIIIFTVQILLNILNGLNLIPYISIKLPLVTMNIPNIVSNIIVLSLLISIYRRKNLIL